jgi:DNA processing protein
VNSDELSAWLRLTQTDAIGPVTARRLLASFGLPQHIFAASYTSLAAEVGDTLARAITAPLSTDLQRSIEKTQAWLEGGTQRRVLTLADPDYPPSLLSIHDPPTLLYVVGDVAALAREQIAVVGSRSATPAGLKNAQAFAADFARQGLGVSSGLALGIDGAAHTGAIEAGGITLAVMGTGPDIVYPSRHKALAHKILETGGAIVSEFPVGTPAIPHQFPRRNRIIAGLSRGVLVVEAAIHSGSLITARVAAEQGREVFAIPGSIHSPQAKGCHRLIKDGAKLVECADDVLSELRWAATLSPTPMATSTDDHADPWLEAAGYDPFTLDELITRTQAPVAELNARLLDWELEGLVVPVPGGRWQRC